MKTIKDVKDIITTEFCANSYIKQYYQLDDNKSFEEQFSVVSFENILFDVLAAVMFVVLQLVNRNNEEVTDKINTIATHDLSWYKQKAMGFQYGFDLICDTDKFDNTNATTEEIEASKIIKQCAVSEVEEDGVLKLIIKVAKEVSNEFVALEPAEKAALEIYLNNHVRDTGVKIIVISTLPDKLKLNFTIRRNPLLLNKYGTCLRTGAKPVDQTVKSYLKSLPFDGKLSLMRLIDEIQNVEGVEDLKLNTAQTAWLNSSSYSVYTDINMSVIPRSGWFKEELEVRYETD